MYQLIVQTARSDNRVLAAYLKGSRANPNVPPDMYQDFDIMYVVQETESFRKDLKWMDGFGKVMLKQEQNDDFGYGERFGRRDHYDETYSWLLLFEDGQRIDIGVETVEVMKRGDNRNGLFVPLLDKIGCLPKLPAPTDKEFYVQRPGEKRYLGCCNEFFWSLCDVVKGILRDELPFAMSTYNTQSHSMLETMLGWYIGSRVDYCVSCGKLNKYLKKYLPEEMYRLYLHTFPDGDYEHFWNAIKSACQLFHDSAILTAKELGVTYPADYEAGFKRYRDMMKGLG